jgi:5-(carboxyamino)imidazole ribonucleotide synthase
MTTIGVLGGGQLGRMLALAGYPLGLRFRFLDPAAGSPVSPLAEHFVADYHDHDALVRFADGLDAITYEFENVPVASVRLLERHAPVYPPPIALEVGQDRLSEKRFFNAHGVPTAPYAPIMTGEELEAAVAAIGLPAILKTRHFGYDGKGQWLLRTEADVEHVWEAVGAIQPIPPLILEGFVPFKRELSLLSVRGRDGATAFYSLIENHHREGILRLSLSPAPGLTVELQALAESHAQRILAALDYVGVLAIEFFVHNGILIANEMAPRVHNSGHWTIEGATCSQFENHLRAVAGLPLGSTATIGHSAMLNLIGVLPAKESVLAVDGAHLHLYGKSERPGRKLGHITVRHDDAGVLNGLLAQLQTILNE